MQVKKFEAKTMKEALDLVKVHLGPEAIILSAKDSHSGFGLMGEKSVEVTAAVSEETLRRKKIAESKLREDLRARFQQIPASKQKEFINRVFENREEMPEMAMAGGGSQSVRAQAAAKARIAGPPVSQESRAQAVGMRYADIPDDEAAPSRSASQERVRRAAERARAAGMDVFQEPKKKPAPKQTPKQNENRWPQNYTQNAVQQAIPVHVPPAAPQGPSAEVQALENQLRELKSIVEKFQSVPQINMTMHPGAEQGLPFELSPVYQRLTQQGMQAALVTQMLKRAQKEMDAELLKKPMMVEAWIVRQLLNSIEISKAPTQSRYHVFMGSTGQGKTTTLVKFASHLVLKEKKTIAIISLDTIKVGATDQLRIYAQILNVPFAIVRTPEEWQVAQKKLAGIQHILVDCPGFNLKSMEEADWLKRMIPPAEFDRSIHYVQSILARDEEAMDLAGRYQMLGFHDVIFTRMDEASRHGMMLNFQEKFRVPLHSFGHGTRIPEDYEFASKERVIDFLFKLSKISKKEESV